METSTPQASSGKKHDLLLSISNSLIYIGSLAITIAFLLKTDLTLIFNNRQPFFSTSSDYLLWHLSYPNGLASYAGKFLFEYYHNGTHAIIISTLLLLCVGYMAYLVYKPIASKQFIALAVVLTTLPTALWMGCFEYLAFVPIDVIVGLGFGAIYQRCRQHKIPIFAILAIAGFYLNGTIGLTIITAIAAFGEWQKKEYARMGAIMLISLILVGIWALATTKITDPNMSINNMFAQNGYCKIGILINIMAVLLIAIMAITECLKKIDIKPYISLIISLIVIFSIVPYTQFKITLNPLMQRIETIDKYAHEGKWQKIIESTDVMMSQSKTIQSFLQQAYYHKNMLLDYLFYFPPVYAPSETNDNPAMNMRRSDIYYDMGFINESRRMANEAMTIFASENIYIYKRLIDCYLISGDYKAAERYMNIAGNCPLMRKWVKEHRKYLKGRDVVMTNPEYREKIELRPSADWFVDPIDARGNFKKITNDPTPNRMAFEYYIADRLMAKDIKVVAESLPKFRQFNYQKLPIAVQEACILYIVQNKIVIDAAGYKIDSNIKKRFNDFSKILFIDYKGDKEAAQDELSKYLQTLWNYYIYTDINASQINTKTASPQL